MRPKTSSPLNRVPIARIAALGSKRGTATSEYQVQAASRSAWLPASCATSSKISTSAPRPVTPPPTPIAKTPPPCNTFQRFIAVNAEPKVTHPQPESPVEF